MSSLFASASTHAGHLFSLPGLRRTPYFARDIAADQSRKTEEFIAANDTVTFEQESIWDGTEWLLLSTAAHEYDELQRLIKTTRGNGRVSTKSWMCCGLLSVAHVSGTGQRELFYSYDFHNKRMRETVRTAGGDTISQIITNGFGQTVVEAAPSTTGFIYTRSEYNAKGQLTRQYQDTGSNTTPTAATLYEYDCFGNVTKQTLKLADTPTVTNSPIEEFSYGVETTDDGVFQVSAQTRYNAEGEPLTITQKQLISKLDDTLGSKAISIDERGNQSISWTEYTSPAKLMQKMTLPTSSITAETISVDGFPVSNKDHAGIMTTASRNYTATGVVLTQTDGRGNATTTVTDLVGRTVSVTNAAGATTITSYDPVSGQPAVITDAMGNTSCYRYDIRGRKVAEWGTGIQPAVFSYDDADRLTTLTTFRANDGDITTDPSERTDGDTTRWTYHDATGLETRKTYADGTHVDKTYDSYNRLSIETLARGITKTHSYEHNRGLLLGTTYSDDTTARSYQYNHLGQLTQVVDDAGTRTIGYNRYGEQETDRLAAGGVTHLITEARDAMGRSTGYAYDRNGVVQQTVTTGYGSDGRITSAGFLHKGAEKQFGYSYLPGTNLLQTLTMPCNMTLTQSFETQRDLLTGMAYKRGTTGVVEREYSYDTLGRPLTRSTARNGQTVNDTFAHNSHSELVAAQVNGKAYEYAYDNIGNRTDALEESSGVASRTAYTANELNQYTSIQENEDAAFVPVFDADGNQTLVKTSTGIWNVEYNAENRPIRFTCEDEATVINCTYDSMGRRATKKVTTNGSVTLHQCYIYRGYLQIACCDLTRSDHPCLWLLTWDPTQTVTTRPLAIRKDGTWFAYGWDITNNICEIFGPAGYIRTVYTYSPYGKVSENGDTEQSIQWNGEHFDIEMGLTYYNWRFYNPIVGKWLVRDFVRDSFNVYSAYKNNPIMTLDVLGLWNDGNYGDLNKNDRTRGHSDFYGNDRFDYTKADRMYYPLNPVFTFMHFRPINVSESNIKNAIKTCDVESFELEMHFMQDFFAHYGQGFRAAPVIPLGVGTVLITLAGQFIIYGDFGHAATSIFGDNSLEPDDAWIYRDAFEQAKEQSFHWVSQWDKCCKLVNAETRTYKPNPCCSISNGKQYGEKAAPPSKNNTLTPFEEKEQIKKREQERIRQDEEYYRHYVLPQMMDEYFYQN